MYLQHEEMSKGRRVYSFYEGCTSLQILNFKKGDNKVVALGNPSKPSGCSNHVLKQKIEKGTPFKRSITKSIEQTSKFTEANVESRTKKYTSCMPKTAVSPNFKAHQLGLARPK